jgi:ankyrin repeat protein
MDLHRVVGSALLLACSNGDVAAVRKLLADTAAASPPVSTSCKDSEGATPLMRAVSGAHTAVVNLLLTQQGTAQVRLQSNVR